MKRVAFVILIIIFSTLVIHVLSQANDNVIYGCYKKNNGQLRIVQASSQCQPSENPISWNKFGSSGPQGPAGPAGPQGPPGLSVESTPLLLNDPNCPYGGTLFRSVSGVTYACNGGGGEGSSIIVRKIQTGQCTNGYGWCPNGFSKWVFRISDPTVNVSSVISINVIDPLIIDSGCEVGSIGAGEFLIFCMGDDYVENGTILHYAVFNP